MSTTSTDYTASDGTGDSCSGERGKEEEADAAEEEARKDEELAGNNRKVSYSPQSSSAMLERVWDIVCNIRLKSRLKSLVYVNVFFSVQSAA